MGFEWKADDILRMPADAVVEYLVIDQAGGECFSLVVDGEVCAVIRFTQNPPWLANFLSCLSQTGFPALTVQDWLAVMGIAPPAFFATLKVLLQCGFILQPQREMARSRHVMM